MKYEHIVRAVFGEPWAILPAMYATICEIVLYRADGGTLTAEEIQARLGAQPVRAGAGRSGAIAVLPLYGVISQRMSLMTQASGGTSTEQFGAAFQAQLADPAVSAIVIDIDSPGGSVYGVEELWATIFRARGQKPVVAVADSMAGSAAYWIASAADEIVVTPSGEVGSIGVLAEHIDMSAAAEQAGIKTTLVTAGQFKGEGHPAFPLSTEALGALQGRVNAYYDTFLAGVAKGRGVPAATVRSDFGQGRMVGAKDAVAAGMVDRVGTLQETIDRLMGRKAQAGARAEVESAPVQAQDDGDAERRQRRLRLLGR